MGKLFFFTLTFLGLSVNCFAENHYLIIDDHKINDRTIAQAIALQIDNMNPNDAIHNFYPNWYHGSVKVGVTKMYHTVLGKGVEGLDLNSLLAVNHLDFLINGKDKVSCLVHRNNGSLFGVAYKGIMLDDCVGGALHPDADSGNKNRIIFDLADLGVAGMEHPSVGWYLTPALPDRDPPSVSSSRIAKTPARGDLGAARTTSNSVEAK